MPAPIIIETVKMIWNNDSKVTHAHDKGYLVTRCGIWYNLDKYHQRKYSVHYHVPGSEPTCKSCRRALGLKPLKDKMQIYEFGDKDVMEEPVWIKTNRNIRLTAEAKASSRYLKKVDLGKSRHTGVDLVIT